MGKSFLFDRIAKVYGLFFDKQVKDFRHSLNSIKDRLNLSGYQSVVDIGCGTGALCMALQEYGLKVIGIDPAVNMLNIATKKINDFGLNNQEIQFMHGDILKGIPLCDKEVDLAISSYVAHGFMPEERAILFNEMKRIARHGAVLLDYNKNRSLVTDVIEWLEGGNYFGFIDNIEDELLGQFGNLEIINTGRYSAIYICRMEQERTQEDGELQCQ
ncbi:MAG: class I SAM-dependent methyltransferase [Natronincolaceae bacterium]|jgi:ubiquinone/menaquinone biosynthesis C-methylase UbiE